MTEQRSGPAIGKRQARAIDHAASQWLARHALGGLTDIDRDRFDGWLDADPAHRLAYDRMSGALSAVDGAGAVVREADRRARVAERGRRLRRAGAAFGVAGIALIAALSTVDIAASLADERTGRGEMRALMLADGSRLTLDADAAVDIDYDVRARTVRLVRGRVHAEVAHGDPRPFRIAAMDGEARDIGTAFDMALVGDRAEALVTEGAIYAINGGQRIRLTEGQGAGWTRNDAPRPILTDMRAASWRYGRLVFDRRRFGDVVATLDRYSSRPVRLWNGRAADRRVSGVVRTAAVDDSIASLAKAQGLTVRDLGFAIILY